MNDVPKLGSLLGRSEVWIGIAFVSDAEDTDSEGAHVDDIVLRKCTAASCTPREGLYTLSNHFHFMDGMGQLHIVGEVRNNTSYPPASVWIPVTLYNDSGNIVTTGGNWTYIALPAGETMCFQIIVWPPTGWSYYVLERPTYSGLGDPWPNAAVLNPTGSTTATGYHITGQVRNDHGSHVSMVQPVGTLYDAAGKVVGCEYTNVDGFNLNPGQTASFEIKYDWRNYSDVASFRVQVGGYLY
jgi:hypothetical protein